MTSRISFIATGVVALCFAYDPAAAQMRPGWNTQIDSLAVFQGSAALSGSGDFKANRVFLRGSSIYNLGDGNSIGLSASLGQFNYDFSQSVNQPWDDIRDVRISVPVRLRAGENASVFFSPQVRWDYESGVSASDGQTYGVFAGIAWKLRENLTIGPAFGAYSQLEKSGTDVFPALLVNWDINDKWNLNTGSGLGATGGPGLTLGYAITDTMKLSLAARSESVRFRLDDRGSAPNGVGEDKSTPVVVSFDYNPNPGLSISVFAGAEFDGRLTLDDASGSQISRQSYDTAPLAGLAVRLRF